MTSPHADLDDDRADEGIEARLCVAPPHFALTGLREVEPGRVTARVQVEADPGRQATVIGTAEAGRHLAILGLCAAATVNPAAGRHFYLARRARTEWLGPATPHSGPAPVLAGHAHAAFTGRRTATARTTLSNGAGPVARAEAGYDVSKTLATADLEITLVRG